MLSPERRAVLLLLALAVVGQGVRYLITRPSEPPGQVQLLSVLPAGSPGAHKDSAMRQARPLQPGERVDADAANASELSRLPRVGLALAKTIVANRDTHGPFGSLAGLDRVPGIGPALARRIVADREARGPFATVEALDRVPGIGPALLARLGKWVSAP